MKIREVVDALERFAPLPLQEDYDNAGLQLGLTDTQEVSGALLCLDVTEAVVDEAVALGCNLIVSHHPLIFRPLKHLTDENQVQRTVRKAIVNNVALISMHTNLDNAHQSGQCRGRRELENGRENGSPTPHKGRGASGRSFFAGIRRGKQRQVSPPFGRGRGWASSFCAVVRTDGCRRFYSDAEAHVWRGMRDGQPVVAAPHP